MSSRRERLSVLVAIPNCFDLMTYETRTGFQIVEPKDIPSRIPIIGSSLHLFFHEALVNHLLKYGAGIENVQRVHIFRKSSNFTSDDYFTCTLLNQWSLAAISANDFRPALINLVKGTSNTVFFSRDYYNKVACETDFVFQELPVIALIPLAARRENVNS
jgi:hypothetical protein